MHLPHSNRDTREECFEVNEYSISTGISASSALKTCVDSAAVKWLEASSWVAVAWLTSSKVALHDTVCRRVTAVHQMPPDPHTHTHTHTQIDADILTASLNVPSCCFTGNVKAW